MAKDCLVYLDDIKEAIEKVEEYVRGIAFEDFLENTSE